MSSRHKHLQLFDDTIKVQPSSAYGFYFIPIQIDHSGKSDHKIHGSVDVKQPTTTSNFDIEFYVLTEKQLVETFLYLAQSPGATGARSIVPKRFAYNGGKISQHKFEIPISRSFHAYFILDNQHSFVNSKDVHLQINEEWDESITALDVVTTIPPFDKSLSQDAERLLSNVSSDLKIITPYIDMTLISELLKIHQQGIDIQIITRTRKEFSGKGAKEAFEHIHENIRNHRSNDLIHSRIIIRDSQEALVSSADLTQDSLIGQFNAGMITTDSNSVSKLLDYFKQVWDKST